MTDTRYIPLASLLIDIECELRRAGLWGEIAPTPEALASTEPFCVDTMGFQDWLQFVFLPRMHTLLETRGPLPLQCNIATMAETVWTNELRAKPVIAVLKAFDEAINSH
jgi:uncharacterized protein YqcC (DUF446 family)